MNKGKDLIIQAIQKLHFPNNKISQSIKQKMIWLLQDDNLEICDDIHIKEKAILLNLINNAIIQ